MFTLHKEKMCSLLTLLQRFNIKVSRKLQVTYEVTKVATVVEVAYSIILYLVFLCNILFGFIIDQQAL
jgi:hypothetical protein